MDQVEHAKLLAALLGVLKKENSKIRDDLLKELHEELDNMTGTKYVQVDEQSEPVPVQVVKGDKGDQGLQGLPGKDGVDGRDGRDGERGARGPKGLRGLPGPEGKQGIPGKDGRDGVDGETPDIKPLEEKFQNLYDTFTGQVSSQITRMAYAKSGLGGGAPGSGEVRLLNLDDVDVDTLDQGEGVDGDGKYLRYNANTQMLEFVAAFNSTHFRYLTGTIFPDQIANGTISISQFNNDSNYANVAYVDTAIANLVDSAPEALDTLWELSDALNNNPNFGAEVIHNLTLKANTSQISTVGFTGEYSDLLNAPSFTSLSSHLIPSANVTYDLGSEEKRWRTLYLSGNTIILGDATITSDGSSVGLPADSTLNGENLQHLIDERLEVANATALFATKQQVLDANNTLVDIINDRLQVSNANITFVTKQTALQSNNALNVLIDDRLQVANAAATYATISDVQTSNNTLNTLINDRLQVANAASIYATKSEVAANNATINNKIDDRIQVANATSTFATKDQVLIANNELIELINDRMQVANVQSLVTTSINNVLDGAPTALDTLNELAAALGDDADFATSIANNISQKANTTLLTQYLQVSNSTSFLVQSDVDQYLQVANSFSGSYNDLTNKPNLDQYLQVANVTAHIANTSTTSAVLNNSVITFTRADNSQYQLDVSSIQGEVSNSYLTSTYVANTTFQSYVANTNVRFTNYMQVANVQSLVTTSINNVLDGAPAALDTLNELAAALGDDANFAASVANSISQKANTTLLTQYLQVANSFSGNYNDLTNKPNLNQYLEAANNKTLIAGDNVTLTENATSILISSTGGGGGVSANVNLDSYLEVANSLNFVDTVQSEGTGTSLVFSKINNLVKLKTIKAGPNITLSETNGELTIAATGELSVSDSLDFGFVNNDFGLITESDETDSQFDFGTI
jgi:hypothetical protein